MRNHSWRLLLIVSPIPSRQVKSKRSSAASLSSRRLPWKCRSSILLAVLPIRGMSIATTKRTKVVLRLSLMEGRSGVDCIEKKRCDVAPVESNPHPFPLLFCFFPILVTHIFLWNYFGALTVADFLFHFFLGKGGGNSHMSGQA